MSNTLHKLGLLQLTSEIVSAYVSHNMTTIDDLPKIIEQVYQTLASLKNHKQGEDLASPLTPAVPIKKSITQDYLICLEDGQKLKMLKRYLKTHYDMNPEQYRERWALPSDYPMVAPNYAKKRQYLARQIGLGKKQTRSLENTVQNTIQDKVQPDTSSF